MAQLVSVFLWLRSIVVFTILGSFYILASLFISPERLQPLGKWACGIFLWAAGQKVILHGPFPDLEQGPYLYLFNHASLLDTFIAISVLPEFTGAIGKKEQFRIPIWGWVLRRWGAVPIERGNLGQAIQSLNQGEAVLSSGRSLLIAPEGTRSKDGELQDFKKGPFHIAVNTKTPIVLMAIVGAFEAKQRGSWLLKPGQINVHILPPIDPIEQDMNALRENTWRILNQKLSELNV